MTKMFSAPTLDDALLALSAYVASREAARERTLIFCEDRLTLLAEHAVLARGGTVLSEVTTFKRFLSGSGRALSKQGSVMALAAIMAKQPRSCFRENAAQTLYETIAQLAASRVDCDALSRCAGETEGLLRLKLEDIAFYMQSYETFLAEQGKVDENGYLAFLPVRIAETLKEVNVVFFAFPSFTAQALEGVRAAVRYAKSVAAFFLDGDAAFYTGEGKRAFSAAASYEEVRIASSLKGEALRLAEALFSPEAFQKRAVQASHIHVFRAADEEEELHTVCALIKKYVAERGMRYKEFAVFVPDTRGFPLAEQVFSAYHIPMFADRRRPFSEHPLCSFLLSVLGAAADGGTPESADAVLSSIYFGGGDEYRNYLLRFGAYRGGIYRAVKEGEAVKRFDREKLERDHARAVEMLRLFRRTDSGRAYVENIRTLCRLTGAEDITQELKGKFTGAQREFLDLSPLWNVLDEFEEVAGDARFTAREFAALLQSGLSATEISMIPQSADAVFVGDITQSKLARKSIVFAVGLTDAVPCVCADAAVITDREIEKLSSLKVKIEPTVAVVNARARESMALNLCAFSKELFLGCPVRFRGEETHASEALSYVSAAFSPAPMPEIFPYDCCERGPAARALLHYKEASERGEAGAREKYFSLRAALEQAGEGALAAQLTGGGEKAPVKEAEALYFSGDISPTLLESYFACPYAGFALRGLRLREREERAMQDTDAGSFVHAVLEETAKRFNEIKDEAQCRELAEKTARELLSTPKYAALGDTDAGKYASERLVAESANVTAAAYRQIALSGFRVRGTEARISLPELHLSGRTDRVDEAGEYVRVIDYKTGSVDDRPVSYYTGRKLQLQLYLLGASKEGKPAGAFYFPAAENFSAEGEENYRMRGFFSKEDEVLSLMDVSLKEGEKSALFEGGGRTEKGMLQSDFEDFLEYSRLVAARAEEEMRGGNIKPSPYEGGCEYCKLKGACGFAGEPRRDGSVSCADIVRIVRKERE